MEDKEYKEEMGELRGNVHQLSTCLDAVLKRIDELEAKKRASELHQLGQKAAAPHEDAVYTEIGDTAAAPAAAATAAAAGGDTQRTVHVQQETTADGAGGVRKVHVTERVVTTKTHYAFSSPDADFEAAPPYSEGAYGTLHRTELQTSHVPTVTTSMAEHGETNGAPAAEPRIIGVRRPQAGKKTAGQCWGVHVKADGDALVVDSCDADAPLGKSGLLHAGDRITAVDGRPVRSEAELSEAFASGAPGDALTITIVPGENAADFTAPDANAKYVRALIGYDPSTDASLPGSGKDAALTFGVGDVLHVLAYDDDKYWQARHVPDGVRVGLIPSRKYELSRRAAAVANGLPTAEAGDHKKS